MDDLPNGFPPGQAYDVPQIEMSPDYFQLLQAVNGGVIEEHELPAHTRPSFARFEEDSEYAVSNAPSRRWSRVSIDSDSDSDNPSGGGADRPESLRSLSGTSFINGTPLGRSTTHLTQPSAQPLERDSSEEPEPGRTGNSGTSNGYYSTFFSEEIRLGMGANGSVFLCQVSHLCLGIMCNPL
jgi:hypothetical protein